MPYRLANYRLAIGVNLSVDDFFSNVLKDCDGTDFVIDVCFSEYTKTHWDMIGFYTNPMQITGLVEEWNTRFPRLQVELTLKGITKGYSLKETDELNYAIIEQKYNITYNKLFPELWFLPMLVFRLVES